MLKPPSIPIPFPPLDTVRERVARFLAREVGLVLVYGHIAAYFLWLGLTIVKNTVGF